MRVCIFLMSMRSMWRVVHVVSGELRWHWKETHYSRRRVIERLSSGEWSSCIRLGPTARVSESLIRGSCDSQSLNTHLGGICRVLGSVLGFEIEMWAGQILSFLPVRQQNWQINNVILYNITGQWKIREGFLTSWQDSRIQHAEISPPILSFTF